MRASRGMVKDIGGRAFRDDQVFVDEHYPVGHLARKTHFVRHHDHGHTFFGQRLHHAQHFADHFWVECRGRLVEQHDARLHGQRWGNRLALLLAARELVGVGIDCFEQPDFPRQFAGPGARLRGIPPTHLQGASTMFSSTV